MSILVGLCLAGFVSADDEEAREILRQAAATMRAVESVRYHVQTTPEGIASEFVSAAVGTAVLSGWNGSIPDRLYLDVETTKPGTEDPLELTAGGDGETFFIIDHAEKRAYSDTTPTVSGFDGGSTLIAAAVFEFVRDSPFDEELEGNRVELQGTETVGGEACHKIYVVYAGGGAASTWWFSKQDLLPRRHIRHFGLPWETGSLEIVIRDLEIDPRLKDKQFKLQLPKGYELVAP